MNRSEYLLLLSEKHSLQGLLDDTPVEDAIDRASLQARLASIEDALRDGTPEARPPARARLTFRGAPVISSAGIFADFGMKVVDRFSEAIAAMAASTNAPLAAMGPIPHRDQYQLLITSTALGSFGFELEEHRTETQLTLDEPSPVAQALERTQSLLQGSLGTDDELADSVVEMDRRALDKVRAFLGTVADNDATCTVQVGASVVSFQTPRQVRTSIERLSQENLRESAETLVGEIHGVLPRARVFELKLAHTGLVIRGKIAPTLPEPALLTLELHRQVSVDVMVTRVGSGRPRYVLVALPTRLS